MARQQPKRLYIDDRFECLARCGGVAGWRRRQLGLVQLELRQPGRGSGWRLWQWWRRFVRDPRLRRPTRLHRRRRPEIVCDYDGGVVCQGFAIPDLDVNPVPGDTADDSDASGPQIITLADIATFTPQSPVQYMQPDRWMVVGLPTNFYTDIAPHVVSGQLLGQPADVRFTPFAYAWNYGDGTAVTHPTPGATWQTLGLNEFDPTPTSHIYEAEGTYKITLTVAYAAEYRYAGGPWTRIAGYLELPANELIAEATSDAVTVLVDRDCTRASRGPGC